MTPHIRQHRLGYTANVVGEIVRASTDRQTCQQGDAYQVFDRGFDLPGLIECEVPKSRGVIEHTVADVKPVILILELCKERFGTQRR